MQRANFNHFLYGVWKGDSSSQCKKERKKPKCKLIEKEKKLEWFLAIEIN